MACAGGRAVETLNAIFEIFSNTFFIGDQTISGIGGGIEFGVAWSRGRSSEVCRRLGCDFKRTGFF